MNKAKKIATFFIVSSILFFTLSFYSFYKVNSLVFDNRSIIHNTYIEDYDLSNTSVEVLNNKINEVILDSNEYISSSLIDYNDYNNVYFSTINYSLFEDGLFNEDFKESKEKTNRKVEKNRINISYEDINEEYYVLFEIKDMYNESLISNVDIINSLVE